MVAYLSDDWVEALDGALASAPRASASSPTTPAAVGRLSVQYRVPDGPGGPRSWHLDLGADRVHARTGEAADPVVVFTQPWTVAAAVAAGRRSATEAVLAGDVAVSGDASALLPWREALRRAGEALAGLATSTEFPAEAPAAAAPASPCQE
jgi:SCP-2 sterol transfer family